MESALRNAVDYVPLVAAKLIMPFLKRCLDLRLEPAKRPFITTEELTVGCVVSDGNREGFDIGDIDERSTLSLEVTRKEPPPSESLASGETGSELDSEIEIR